MCHLWTAAWQGWLCISDILCSRCTHSWSVAGFPNLCRNVKLWVVKLNKICRSHSLFRFRRCRIDDTRAVHLRKITRISTFSWPLLEGRVAFCPAQGQITTIHRWTTNIVLFVHAQPCDCLFNSLHEPTSKGTSNLWFIVLLWGKPTGDRWIPLSKGQWCGKGFHIMKDIMNPGSWSLTENSLRNAGSMTWELSHM